MTSLNNPALWRHLIPVPDGLSHKYSRGCAVIFGGRAMTGATRLASGACGRIGAGLTIVVSPSDAASIYRAALPPHIIVEDFTSTDAHLSDHRRNAVLIGPGAGTDKDRVLAVLAAKRSCVLDADALTAFADAPDELLKQLHALCVLTPHPGEFAKLFPGLDGDAWQKAEAAALRAGCTIVLKGGDCAIAHPEEATLVHDFEAPYLATAGSGDVLAGMITGLLAEGMKPYDAAACAVWLHRSIGRKLGVGLVAGDIAAAIPGAMRAMLEAA